MGSCLVGWVNNMNGENVDGCGINCGVSFFVNFTRIHGSGEASEVDRLSH